MSLHFALVGASLLSLAATVGSLSPAAMAAQAAPNGRAIVANEGAAASCHTARGSYKAAKAAATAADDENARRLFQNAIEQFELCRDSETVGSTSEVTDEYYELDAQIMASGYFMDADNSHAVALLISAVTLLSNLCYRKSLPESVRESLWVDVKVYRAFAPRLGLGGWGACPSIQLTAPTPGPQ